LLREVEEMFTVSCELVHNEGTPAVKNDAEVVERVLACARLVVDPKGVVTVPPVAPSDDVSEFLNRVPGCYLLVGGALADGSSGMHHSPDFSIDDDACRVVAGVLAASAVDLAQS
jgi:amidohydrolase